MRFFNPESQTPIKTKQVLPLPSRGLLPHAYMHGPFLQRDLPILLSKCNSKCCLPGTKKIYFPSRIPVFYLPIPNDSCEGSCWRISSAFFMYSKSFHLYAVWHFLIRASLRPRDDSPGEKSWHVYSSSVFPESQGHQVCCKGVQVLYFLSQPKWHNEKVSEMPRAQI